MTITNVNNKACNIYDNLTTQVSALINNIITEINNEEAKNTFDNIKTILENIVKEVAEENEKSKRYAEWEKFTIALYGETNAGKSTIIETLRIIWKEKQKLKNAQDFKYIQEKHNLTQENFDCMYSQIQGLESEIRDKQKDISEIDFDISHKKETLKQLEAEIPKYLSNRKHWKRVIANSIIKNKVNLQKASLIKIINLKQKKLSEYDSLKKELDVTKSNLEVLSEQKNLLIGLEDGHIIGDGRSDYTKVNTIYSFKTNNTIVDIIDVPGIEGNESAVLDEILNAVRKAHCIFYITRKATVPQTVDNKEGTIQKIKQHLGAQTEVWTIFNQSIKSVRRLSKDLISEEELNSLKDLNLIMKNELGEDTYCGEIVLSAYVAFLAVSECLIPNSKTMIEKLNFTSKLTPKLMLESSKFCDFEKLLSEEIIKNKKDKIYKANYNKAMYVLDETINEINSIIKKQIEPLKKDMETTYDNAVHKIDLEEKCIKSSFEIYHNHYLDSFITICRKELHKKIDEGIENEKIEEECRTVVENNTAFMQESYEKGTKVKVAEFENKIYDIVKDTLKYYDKITTVNKKMNFDLKYEFNFDFKSGFNPKELKLPIISIIITGIFLLSGGTLGVLAIISIAVSALSGLYRSSKNVFSDKYKKKQQKEAVDKFLTDVKEKIKEKFKEQNNEISKQISICCKAIIDLLKEPIVNIDKNNEYLKKALKDIKCLK